MLKNLLIYRLYLRCLSIRLAWERNNNEW